MGDGSDFLDGGIGPWLQVDRWFDANRHLGLSVDFQWLFLEPDIDQILGGRADNDLASVVAGPALRTRLGPVHPWVKGFAGILATRWEIRTGGVDERGTDVTFAWGGALGLDVTLTSGDHPLALVAESRITKAGALDFARAPDPLSSGPWGLLHRDVAILSLRVGVSLGL